MTNPRRSEPQRPDDRLAKRGGVIEWLRVPAALMRVATGARAGLYDRGWMPVARLDVPVVSVGNVTAGGTGKTPLVEWVARYLLERGRRPGLLSRGYGAQPGAGSDAAAGTRTNDEAAMLERSLPGVPHIAQPDRVGAGLQLQSQGIDVIVLDDGFQHRRLHRDLDVVAVDALRPWGLPAVNGTDAVRALLPRGLLREAPTALARAHAIVVTRSDQVEPEALERLCAELHLLAPGAPLLRARHAASGLRKPDGSALPLTDLGGLEVTLVSGIGNPAGFEATARSLGAQVRDHLRFRDHHAYDSVDAAELTTRGTLLTTAKDAVKLAPLGVRALTLEVGLEFTSGGPILEALLDALPAGGAELRRRGYHEGLHG